ncbi:flavin reductase family protein [Nocardioides zeae]|uniref:Flavin reductase family protein n=1 Tax=Nocardioides zeae TaxID=1457234 RepID=A0A6P0HLI5_9ACTN|nr:flavin reductase family protein [Nocardioides zeae]NEN79461.1 flavin reductase family protein [Nocardioides zeae]
MPDTPCAPQVAAPDLRAQLARWPSGVAVVTATGAGRPIAKTVNSFHSTSTDPPLVGWCLDHGSSQLDEWMAADGYVVHVLAEHQTHLVAQFAARRDDRFAGTRWSPGLDGMPVLDDDVAVRFECRVRHRLPAGDHTYLIGEVVTLTAGPGTPLLLRR